MSRHAGFVSDYAPTAQTALRTLITVRNSMMRQVNVPVFEVKDIEFAAALCQKAIVEGHGDFATLTIGQGEKTEEKTEIKETTAVVGDNQ